MGELLGMLCMQGVQIVVPDRSSGLKVYMDDLLGMLGMPVGCANACTSAGPCALTDTC